MFFCGRFRHSYRNRHGTKNALQNTNNISIRSAFKVWTFLSVQSRYPCSNNWIPKSASVYILSIKTTRELSTSNVFLPTDIVLVTWIFSYSKTTWTNITHGYETCHDSCRKDRNTIRNATCVTSIFGAKRLTTTISLIVWVIPSSKWSIPIQTTTTIAPSNSDPFRNNTEFLFT